MDKILNSSYGAIFGTYWVIYAVISSFSSVFMLAKGYTNSEIGITLATANVLAVILQPLIADFADRSKKLGVLGVTEIMTVCMMIFLVGMFAFGGGSLALCAVFVLLIGFHTVLQPFFNSLAFRLEQCGVAINYGIARAVGSLAYSVFVAFFGTLVEKHGVDIMPVAGEISCLLLIASLVFTGHYFKKAMRAGEGKSAALKKDETDSEEINLVQFMKRNRMFFVMSLGIVGLYFSNSVLNFYMAQIVDGVGGTTEDMGRILGVMAFLEIPTMVFFKQLKNRFSCRTLLKVASIGFTVKIALCWLAQSVLMLYVAHIFQLVSFALFLPGMVYFTNEIMSRGEAIKGQALYTTMITIATVISSLLGGIILDAAGPRMLTFIATLVTAIGAAIIIFVIDKVKGGKQNV
ncbi:MAG: MFS transporter [Clostridia bacterium]|nr:MFS transporter [Clostridia bacterium]